MRLAAVVFALMHRATLWVEARLLAIARHALPLLFDVGVPDARGDQPLELKVVLRWARAAVEGTSHAYARRCGCLDIATRSFMGDFKPSTGVRNLQVVGYTARQKTSPRAVLLGVE